jgi:hypothetical protein
MAASSSPGRRHNDHGGHGNSDHRRTRPPHAETGVDHVRRQPRNPAAPPNQLAAPDRFQTRSAPGHPRPKGLPQLGGTHPNPTQPATTAAVLTKRSPAQGNDGDGLACRATPSQSNQATTAVVLSVLPEPPKEARRRPHCPAIPIRSARHIPTNRAPWPTAAPNSSTERSTPTATPKNQAPGRDRSPPQRPLKAAQAVPKPRPERAPRGKRRSSRTRSDCCRG